MQIIIHDSPKRNLKVGDGFGELALLYNSSRSASVKTIGNCCFWAIDRATFRTAIEELVYQEYSENRKFIEGTAFFSIIIMI